MEKKKRKRKKKEISQRILQPLTLLIYSADYPWSSLVGKVM